MLADPALLKVGHNAVAYDAPILARHGMPIVNMFDTIDARRALSSTSPLGLGYLASLYDDTNAWKTEDEGDEKGIVLTDDLEKLKRYNAQDCVETARVYEAILAEPEWGTERVKRLYDLHTRLAHLASKMHANGFKVDAEARWELARELEALRTEREAEVIRLVNVPGFRCTPNDLRAIIFKRHAKGALQRFNLPDPIDKAMWTDDQFETVSVDQHALLLLTIDPSCPPELRQIIKVYWTAEAAKKARSTFVVSAHIDHALGKDGRLRAGWNPRGTDTGRWSCSKPNLQNLAESKDEGSLSGNLPNLRRMYAAQSGRVLVHADFSQLELRVMRHVARDDSLGAALESGDVYAFEAKAMFGLPAHLVKCECKGGCKDPENHLKNSARKAAKIIRLGRQYGAQPPTVFAQGIKLDRSLKYEAVLQLCERWDKTNWRTVEYWKEEAERVAKCGYSESRILQRRRSYPRMPDRPEIANYPIQSTAADIANIAFLAIDDRLTSEVPSAKFLTHEHDALSAEVDEKDADLVSRIFKQEMEREFIIDGQVCIFPAKVTVGKRWSDV